MIHDEDYVVDEMDLDRRDEEARLEQQEKDSLFDDKLEREFWRMQDELDPPDRLETNPITGELYVAGIMDDDGRDSPIQPINEDDDE